MNKLLKSYALLLLVFCFVSASQVRAESIDLVGDTFGAGAVRHDITSTSAVFTNSLLTLTVNFAGNISPVSALTARSLVGYIDIDADRNPLTGVESVINVFAPGPSVALGVDYFIDLYSEEFLPGRVEVLNDLFDVVGEVPITFGANSFSVAVPLSILGGGGLVNYGVIVGTLNEATDRAPNGSVPLTSTPVPEPATLLLLGSGLAGVAARFGKKLKDAPKA